MATENNAPATTNNPLTRRSITAMMAASAVAMLHTPQAAAANADPVFAAIEDHREANAFFSRCLDQAEAINGRQAALAHAIADQKMQARLDFEATNPAHKFASSRDELRAKFASDARSALENTPEGIEAAALEQAGGDRDQAAAIALLRTVPTTLAGALALLHYVAAAGDNVLMADDDGQDGYYTLIASMIAALTPLAVQS